MNCPNCTTPMDRFEMDGVYGPEIEVDLCFACHVIWLDKRESLHLSPRGTLDLFKLLHEHRDDPRHSLASRLECPRCSRRLSLSQDISKAGRFSYYECPAREGRLTPFSEFLKEKQFVRALNPAERNQLRAEVKSVQCSRCGAPVELTAGFDCGHCGAGLTVLDADAVEKTLRKLDAADAMRSVDRGDAEARARALAAMEGARSHPDDFAGAAYKHTAMKTGSLGVDLLSATIGFIFGN